MTDQQPGDSLFFHFSGHGSQQYDRNGDEEDGYDETICPTDFRRAGQIVVSKTCAQTSSSFKWERCPYRRQSCSLCDHGLLNPLTHPALPTSQARPPIYHLCKSFFFPHLRLTSCRMTS